MAAATYKYPDQIVSTEWLAENSGSAGLRVFDCTVYLHYEEATGQPYRVESGQSDYDAGHIPSSAFLNLQTDLSDNASPFRFTMPALEELAQKFAQHGIGLIDCEDPALTCQEEKNANWMVSLHTCIFDRWLMR